MTCNAVSTHSKKIVFVHRFVCDFNDNKTATQIQHRFSVEWSTSAGIVHNEYDIFSRKYLFLLMQYHNFFFFIKVAKERPKLIVYSANESNSHKTRSQNKLSFGNQQNGMNWQQCVLNI